MVLVDELHPCHTARYSSSPVTSSQLSERLVQVRDESSSPTSAGRSSSNASSRKRLGVVADVRPDRLDPAARQGLQDPVGVEQQMAYGPRGSVTPPSSLTAELRLEPGRGSTPAERRAAHDVQASAATSQTSRGPPRRP